MAYDMQLTGNEALAEAIREQIRASGDGLISFKEYMELCLYHPVHGYYMNNDPKVGLDGDFYTSSHIGTIMGEMLAHAIARYWEACGERDHYVIAEWGGGTGRLAGQVLDELERAHPGIYSKLRYRIIDKSAYHRGLQEEAADRHAERITIHDPQEWESFALPERAVILSNELLDAFPVHRLLFAKGQFHEIMVGWDEEQGRWIERHMPLAEGHALRELIRMHHVPAVLKEGQMLELNPSIAPWMRSAASALASGMIVTIDYGDLAEHLYTANRMRGTYMCYYRHQGHDDPYVHIGKQDITAHVNFSLCIDAGNEAGITEYIFESQRSFLMRAGLLDRLVEHQETDPFHPVVRRNRAIRSIMLGDDMGETFKVLIQKKDGPA